ncbi:MAG: Mut7-C RNAse domain-containing protein [Planctomycetota bacterium]
MSDLTFLCDDMFQGLARWLRAAGYDAACSPGVPDGDLVRRAEREGRILITSDSRMMERRVIQSGRVRTLFMPRGLRNEEALACVIERLNLAVGETRCMACGGALDTVPKESVAAAVPPIAYGAYDEFFKCAGCAKIYWHGTHWESIVATLQRAARSNRTGDS